MAFIDDLSPSIAINRNTAVSSCYPSTSSIDIDRRNNQPGNVKHRRARATSSNIDDLVRKRTGLSSIVRKRTSFQPSCASARATASAMGLHKLFSCPVRPLDQQQEQSIDNQSDRLITMIINMLS